MTIVQTAASSYGCGRSNGSRGFRGPLGTNGSFRGALNPLLSTSRWGQRRGSVFSEIAKLFIN